MPQKFKLFFMIGILALFLAACGTSNDPDVVTEDPANSEQPIENIEDPVETEEELEKPTPQENNTETEDSEEGQSPSNSTASHATEMSITYSLNGETKQETAYWTESDNQSFGLNVLSTYELSAEEPNKDILYFKENDTNMMRIEILPGDSDENALQENTLAQLKVVNENVKTIQAPEDEFFHNATVMQASNNEDVVTSYLINQQDSIIKLTIFTKEIENHLDAFVQMAKTLKIQ